MLLNIKFQCEEILVFFRSCDLALRTPRYNGHPDNTGSR